MVKYNSIEDMINELMKDGQILNKRLAAARQLRSFLENRSLQNLLEEYQISDEAKWQAFCRAEDPAYSEVKGKILETLGRRYKRYFSMLEAESKTQTAKELAEKVWEKQVRTEITNFAKDCGTTYNTVMRFFTGSWYTSQEALDSFASGMHLTGKERQAFLDSAPKGIFSVTPGLLDKVNEELDAQGIGLLQFLDANYMTDGAWAPFRKEKAEKAASGKEKTGVESRSRITTQETLLKLAVGFKMTPDESRAFLQLVNSDFLMRLDVVVLACIYCKVYEPEQLYYILEAFSHDKNADGYGKARFANLYAGYALLADQT